MARKNDIVGNENLKKSRQAPAKSGKSSILAQLARLETLPMDELKPRWRALFGTEPPGYNRKFLIKRLAYRIQEIAHGGLPREANDRMSRFLEEEGYDDLGRPGAKPKTKMNATPVAGTVFVREWNGERHEVRAVTDGFEYRGKQYKSLSAVARDITGTRWNGPRFFGLRDGGKVDVRGADEQR